MKIISEMLLEVDNEIYQGPCRLIELDEYEDVLYDNCFSKLKVIIDEEEYEIFPVISHYKMGDIEGD